MISTVEDPVMPVLHAPMEWKMGTRRMSTVEDPVMPVHVKINWPVNSATENSKMENATDHGFKRDAKPLVAIILIAAVTRWAIKDANDWSLIVMLTGLFLNGLQEKLVIAAKKLVENALINLWKNASKNDKFLCELTFRKFVFNQQKSSYIACQQNYNS